MVDVTGRASANGSHIPARPTVSKPAGRSIKSIRVINQRLFETSLDLIVVVDRWGNIIRISPSAESILGYHPDELMGRSAGELLYPDDLDSTRNEMRLARRGGCPRNFDCRYVRKDGSVVTLAWKGVWSETEQQHFFIGRDMTERIKLEQQLHQAQKMESIGQLTGGVAHDFNNILTIIIGMNEVLASAVAGQPKLAEIAKAIDDAAERGVQLTQRMLSFARKQPLQTCVLNLNEIVDRAASMLRQTLGEDIKVETGVFDELWHTQADPSRLEDAIVNLAVNARDAMPKGGRLLIETANVHFDEEYAASHAEVFSGDYAAIFVSDSGTGMPREVMERAFEPFFTTKEVGRGTGLGLSMVYGFVKQSRGHVKIYSELGHGTTIKLYLPRVIGVTTDMPSASFSEAAMGGREAILVVEDDADVRKIATSTLESSGYLVLEAADGKTALEVLDGPREIDLLFTDLVMPNGISGQDLLGMAREHRSNLKALFTSGYSEQFIRGQHYTHQGVSLLEKPYRRHQLLLAVRKALDGTT